MSEAERLCDQIIFLKKGKILLQGKVKDIVKNKNLEKIYFNVFKK